MPRHVVKERAGFTCALLFPARWRGPSARLVPRDPEQRAFHKVAIVVIAAEVAEPLDADETLVREEPVERLVEEAWVAPADLESEE